MSPEQDEHLGQLLYYYLNHYPGRYKEGAIKYKTNLWEYSFDWYIDNAIEELFDALAYLISLKLNKKRDEQGKH